MNNKFYLSIDAHAVYGVDAPTLEVLVNGSVVYSTTVTGAGAHTYDLLLDYPLISASPASLTFRFADASVEGGRTLTLDAVRVNGQTVSWLNMSQQVLLHNDVSNMNIGATDHLFGRVDPVQADLGTPTLTGTGSADHLTSSSGNDIIDAGNGDDRVRGLGGDDAINGGAGNDLIFGEAGNDIVIGDTGDDQIFGNAGNDLIYGQAGNDTLDGGAGNDVLNGGANDDMVLGGDGNDLIFGDTGNDVLMGEAGDDWLYGDDGDDMLDGGDGNDTLNGGNGNDTLVGELGDDTINGDAGDDFITGDAGNDTISGGDGNDFIFGGDNNDTIGGGNNDDKLYGDAGADTVSGDDGDDLIVGGSGADVLNGGNGNDIIYAGGLDSAQLSTILAAPANAAVTFSEQTNSFYKYVSGTVSYAAADAAAQAALINGVAGHLVAVNSAAENAFVLTLTAGAQTWIGTGDAALEGQWTWTGGLESGAPFWMGGVGINNLYANWAAANPVVDNTLNAAVMNASGQWDDRAGAELHGYIIEWEAASFLDDGAANTLNGDANDDILYGGSGNDTINGGSGNDQLFGGAGNDTMAGGTGNDFYVVDAAGDSVVENAAEGTDTVLAGVTYTLSANLENLTLSGTGNINGTGNASANILVGNSGNNTLDGQGGADAMTGGKGNDTYVVDNAADTVIEAAGEGTDLVQSSVTHTLSANVENLTLTGATNINGTGNALDNIIIGNTGNNVLDGGAGNDSIDGGTGTDTMTGGAGNDTFTVDNAGDTVSENAAEGTDLVQSSVTYTITDADVENLTLTGSGNINGTGNGSANVITGNSGDNILDDGGDAVIDTLIGGAGNDIYVVTTTIDTITENAAEGTDLVMASVSYSLAAKANVENLTLTGTAASGIGNTLNNVITGNASNNTINGGTGTDTMIGGLGNDNYTVDDPGDVVTENAAEGTDTINASITFSLAPLANVENLTLTGSSNINGTGNASGNVITGNTGNNILDGGAGTDTLVGGTGNDTYVVDTTTDTITENAAEGTDEIQSSITFSLAASANIENLTLTGAGNINGTGNGLDNVITGNTGNNILDGGAGTDTMAGGTGNDTYIVDTTTDTITENVAEGTDLVQSSVTYTIGANIENLTLTGAGNINGTGNASNNVITGNTGNNALDGGTGTDTLIGGTGNDTYIVDTTTDTITENAAEGTDLVQSSVTFSLSALANLENLTLTGASNIDGTGNAGNNILTGNTGNNMLDGGAGTDTLIGGTGNDTYVVDTTTDTITENAAEGTDQINASITFSLAALTNIENLTLTGVSNIDGTGNGGNNVITGNTGNNLLDGGTGTDTLIGGTGNDTYIVDTTTDTITENAAEGTDQVNASVTYTLSANLENLTLTGGSNIDGTGNAGNNVITGNTGNNTLDGGSGTDTLIGGTGNDTYVVDTTTDTITENAAEGTDLVQSSITFSLAAINNVENLTLTGAGNINGTGNGLNNVITGNTGNNALDGGAGTDTLIGGTGNDTYIVDTTTDTITENAAEGTDLVQSSVTFSLAALANIENLTLTGASNIDGTGNAGNNVITGNTGNNVLDGGAGTDTMAGGTGNDTYIVDTTTDTITENVAEGTDQVNASVTYTLGANIENLTLTGGSNIDGTGNTGNNVITGNAGNNTLDGGAGTDTLIGGAGNDTYIVDTTTDAITENAAEGTDLVQSSVTFSLAAINNVENLTLTGAGNINGTGNGLDNVILGNTGNNSLNGGAGNDTLDGGTGTDTLIGGTGNDTFIVDTTTDTITENAAEGTDLVQSSVTFSLAAINNVENLTLTGAGNVNGTGNGLDNVITGNTGNNTLDGGAGTDTLIGGTGNDTYVVDTTTDTITENAAEGTDLVQSSVTFSLAAINNVENLTLTGAGNINGTGNALDNVITGNTGNNALDGGAGTDTLIGGTGNDTYIVDTTTDTITENAAEGTDLVQSSVTFSLAALANLENLTLTGASNIDGTGNAGNNVITGNTGNNTLDGGTGTDTLIGGTGNDTYIVDTTTDTITENAAEGTDLVQSSITFSLAAINNVENLTLTGATNIDGTGNALNNVITGNTGNNTLDGGAGTDTLIGGAGNDTYTVDTTTDTITENAAEGTDLVNASITFSLAAINNVENLTLTGVSSINGTGNALNNVITGNSGNNALDGGAGTDTLIGGTGNDTYIVDTTTDTITENAAEGTDLVQSSVTFSLAALANLENLTLTGASNIDATGNAGNNVITGNTGNNALDGGAGTDTLIGGTGNDTYIVDTTTDTITENAAEGTDLVQSSVTFSLAALANLENLTLTGASNIDGTGNANNNVITGNSGNNTLDGGAGTDTMAGGTGNDTYIVDTTTDTITENAAEGTDLVQSSVTYTLGANVENLTLTGGANINGTGNGLDNVILGNTGNNSLTGGAGNDTLDGGTGTDTLIGGTGNDTYIVDTTADTITENAAEGTDEVQSSVTYTLGVNLENLTLTGAGSINGTGNASNNVITGNSGNNALDGGTGTDTLIGGTGNDTYTVDTTTDTITENAAEGTDLVQSSVTYTLGANLENLTLTGASNINGTGNGLDNVILGNTGNNSLTGGAGNDSLDGGTGTDTLIGGTGNDTYIVDTTTDTITENAAEGTDLVQSSVTYTLGANVENLTLTGAGNVNGTGNGLDNVITGNGGNNILDGGAGTDTLIGGLGNDTYTVDTTADTITENVGEGTDQVNASVTYTLGANLENLTLTGGSNINGTGNAGNNVITGNTGNNTLDGGSGTDTLIGGTGNDIYIVDTTTDTITENAAEGTDEVQSSVTFSLAAINNVEDLTLTGSANINGTGNGLDNDITGNSGNNSLTGGAGNDTLDGGTGTDTLIGGTGNDTYIVDTTTDTITENAAEGTDLVQSSVTYTLGANLENLTLTGAGNISGTGNASNNVITGNGGDNVLDGGTGTDTLIGGAGNDTYTVDSTTDTVTENAAEGTDLVNSSVTYTLGSNIENLTLTGGATINGTGNTLDNLITGNGVANVLSGGTGIDTINAGGGDDTLYATYAPMLNVAFGAGSLGGFTGADGGFGGSQGAGVTVNETNTAGDGNLANGALEVAIVQTGTFTNASGNFSQTVSLPTAEAGMVLNFSYRHFHDTANDTGEDSRVHVQVDGVYYDAVGGSGASETTYYLSQGLGVNGQTDTGWVSVSLNLGTLASGNHTITFGIFQTSGNAANEQSWARFDDVFFGSTEAVGNTLNGEGGNDVIYGSTGNDLIDGGTGNDTMVGGDGNDTYAVDSASDVVTELAGEGTDTVNASISYTIAGNIENLTLTGVSNINGTGDAGNNVITGNSGNNAIDGGGGTDTLIGGAGNDTYIVDTTTDTITENAAEGTDLVQSSVTYILGANLENLTLTGGSNIDATGNGLNNVLTGNTGNNVLDGGAGTDTMAGGTGNDTYIVDTASDSLTEAAASGTDEVQSSVTWTLAANFENLTLTGSSNINATGNTANNVITGNSGNNTLDGNTGTDTLIGGAGNDIYIVDSTTDSITENVGEGTDEIQSSVTFNMSAILNVENLTLTGSSNINATGNDENNVITGNSGNNTLDGGAGADTLYGGAGNDTLIGGAGDISLNGGANDDTVTSGSVGASGWVQAIVDANPGVTYYSGTGNFYQYVTSTVSATTAFASAGVSTLNGVNGHLITITSSGENVFMNAQLVAQGWIGAYDQGDTNNWIWNTGPENGQAVSYTNWLPGEPNDQAPVGGGPFIYARMDINGQWLDTNNSGTLYGYVIEWEGTALTPASYGTILHGDAGNDVLTGGSGGDTLYGDAGTDTLTAVGTGFSGILSAGFTTGNDSFTYADGGFGGSDGANVTVDAQRTTTDGGIANGALEIAINETGAYTNASGNWSQTFNLASTATGVQLDLSYRHFHDTANDAGEDSRVHLMIDGVYYNAAGGSGASETTYYLSQGLGTNGQTDTGWVPLTINLGTLSAGSHTITLGIFQNAGNAAAEGSWVRFDDISMTGNMAHGNTTILDGGAGVDTLNGGTGRDHFFFEAATAFSGIDVVNNFSTAQGDALDISDILSGTSYNPGVSAITNFLQITDSGANSVVKVDVTGTGTFGAATQIATLNGITGLTNEALLLTNGNIID